MIRERCEKCGESFPAGAGHECASEPRQAMPDPPAHYDEKAWRKAYMKEYMRRKRARERREKDEAQKPKVGTEDGQEKASQEG
jgi:hypothetical protein